MSIQLNIQRIHHAFHIIRNLQDQVNLTLTELKDLLSELLYQYLAQELWHAITTLAKALLEELDE